MTTAALRVVPDLLRRSARLVPRRPAVSFADRPALTFADLESRSNAFAGGLLRRGVGRGDRVALLHHSGDWLDYVVAYFGVLKVGAVALLAGDRFTDEGLQDLNSGYGVVAALTAADGAELEGGQSTDQLPIDAAPDDPAEVIFTSGTTARPRGVVATHGNLVRAQGTWPSVERVNQPCAHALPLGSVAAQAVLLNCVGGQHTMLVLHEFTVDGFAELVERGRASTVCLVPTMGHWMVREAGRIPPLPSVRGVSFSGAALPAAILPDLPKVFPNAAFHNFYTSTEAYPARVATRFDPRRPDAVGRPVGGTAVRVTGEDGAERRAGEIGEIWLRASGAPPRRLVDPDEAPGAAGTVHDGWTRTGDLGYVDVDGNLFLTGRAGDTVNVGGFNVSTGRVEQVLGRHGAVAEAAAVGVDHPVLGQVVAAFVVLRADATVRELRQHAAGHLTRRELPAVIRLVDDLPHNPAGKVVKRHLPPLLDAPGATGFIPPRSDLEHTVAAVWADVLDLGMVSATDNFFEIGGDSLAASRIAARLGERLGLDLDAVAVFEAPSVAELAEHIQQDGRTDESGRRLQLRERDRENPRPGVLR